MPEELKEALEALNPAQRAFLNYYTGECLGNGRQSYIKAYGSKCEYDGDTADAASSALLKNVKVGKALSLITNQQSAESKVTAEYLTQERLSAVERCKSKGLESPLDKHLQALDKHIGYYEADNAQQSEKTLMLSEEQWSELMARRAQLEAQAACIDVTAAIAT